nr:ABC transporter permease [Elusimicrobiota bacterium]
LGIMPGNLQHGGASFGRGAVSRLTMADAAAIKREVPDITKVDGNVSGNVQAVYNSLNTRTSVTGALPIYASMRNAAPYYGRFFTEQENKELKRVCLVGQTVATALFGAEDPVGRSIKLNRKNFSVIGVLPMKGAGGFRDQDDMVLVPLNTAMSILLGKQYVDNIWVEVSDYKLMPQVQDAIVKLMRKRTGTPAWKDDPVSVMNMADLQSMLSSTVKTFSLLLGFIAGISLVVGGIGIMNIMLVSVSERTREIGLRKAIGATKKAILLQFLIEAIIVSVTGGIIGILLGAGASVILSRLAGWSIYISPASVGLAFGFSAGVGVVFGFWPARKASELSPIEALRYE